MKEKAIKKLRDEMTQNSNGYVLVVGGFLIQHLELHPEAAEKILAQDKTIIKSLDEMKKAAEKKKVGNCAVLTDQEGFAAVLKYYGLVEAAGTIKAAPEVKKAADIDFDIKLEDLI